MSYVFHNLSDERLAELLNSVLEERKRRFLSTADKYPKLPINSTYSVVDGVKCYRDAYSIGLTEAHMLFNFYHR